MPIRFRCVYCDKLLGIARRKAGAVVNCPQCGQPLIVPSPEPEPQPAAVSAPPVVPLPSPGPAPAPLPEPNRLFERDDFDVLLADDRTYQAPPEPEPSPRRPRKRRDEPDNPLPPKPFALEQSLPAPSDRYPAPVPIEAPKPAGLVLTTGKLILALGLMVVLVVGAFAGGLLVGRGMQ